MASTCLQSKRPNYLFDFRQVVNLSWKLRISIELSSEKHGGDARWIKWNEIRKTLRTWHMGNPHKGLHTIILWWQKLIFITILFKRFGIYLSYLMFKQALPQWWPGKQLHAPGHLRPDPLRTSQKWERKGACHWPKNPLLRLLSWVVLFQTPFSHCFILIMKNTEKQTQDVPVGLLILK